MDIAVKNALQKSLTQYAKVAEIDAKPLLDRLLESFDSNLSFMEKLDGMDAAIDDFSDFEEIREFVFDLLLTNFFSEDVKKLEEDYLESQEWADIEVQTLDRGTEMLNMLLYLQECADEEIEPDLEDFLKEFLLVEEDEFQDEHRIYEPVLANQILADSSYEEISKAARKVDPESELFELFYALISYFYVPEPEPDDFSEFIEMAPNPALDGALYTVLINYK